jgi:hypothetical protein
MTDYSDLLSNLQDWNEDDSSEFSADVPVIIQRAEDRLFLDIPDLLSYKATETGSLTESSRVLTPAETAIRIVKSLAITVSSKFVFLTQKKEEYIDDYWPNVSTEGQPKFFARLNETQIIVAPTPDSAYAYTLRHLRVPARLTSGNTSTFLSAVFPGELFRACMYEAAIFLNRPIEIKAELKGEYTEASTKMGAEVKRSLLEGE